MIDARKGGGRVDKDIGLRLKGTIGKAGGAGVLLEALEGVFHGADAGGSDRDARTGGRILKGGEACGGDGVPFVVDGMLADVLDLNGMKGANADLEGQVVEGGATCFELADELGGKMETGGGSGDCLLFGIVGVHGLVAMVVALLARVVGAAFDIGREGHNADAFGEGGDGFVVGGLKADAVVAVLSDFEDLGGELAGLFEGTGGEGFFAGLEEAPPGLGIFGGVQEEAFDFSAGGALTVEAGFEDGGIVAEAARALGEVFADLVEGGMADAAGGAVDDHEAGGVAPGRGFLRDAFRREVIVEAGGVHGLK